MQFLSHRMQFLGRLLGGLMLSVAVFSLSGCMTQALLNSDVNYKEKISSILVTEDGKKMLIIGQDYHYIFNVNPQIYPPSKLIIVPRSLQALIVFLWQMIRQPLAGFTCL